MENGCQLKIRIEIGIALNQKVYWKRLVCHIEKHMERVSKNRQNTVSEDV